MKNKIIVVLWLSLFFVGCGGTDSGGGGDSAHPVLPASHLSDDEIQTVANLDGQSEIDVAYAIAQLAEKRGCSIDQEAKMIDKEFNTQCSSNGCHIERKT
jgi:hypothetical protein